MPRSSSLPLALMLGLMLLSGCSEKEKPFKIDLTKREVVSVHYDEATITYAYAPQFSHAVSHRRHHPLIQYLRKATGLSIKQVFPDTFDEHMRMVGQGKIDISFSNPFIYVKMANDYCAHAFARVVEASGDDMFRGEIICRADNPSIRTLADVRGKRWIAVDPSSAGGYLYPLGFFIANGIERDDFASIAFSPGPGGKQEKVILAVYAGQYDIGSVREGALDVVADRIDTEKIRIIARTPWYPGWVYAASRELDPAIVAKIQAAMTALDPADPEGRKVLDAAHIVRIIPSRDEEYQSVRDLWSRVGSGRDRCLTIPQTPPEDEG